MDKMFSPNFDHFDDPDFRLNIPICFPDKTNVAKSTHVCAYDSPGPTDMGFCRALVVVKDLSHVQASFYPKI